MVSAPKADTPNYRYGSTPDQPMPVRTALEIRTAGDFGSGTCVFRDVEGVKGNEVRPIQKDHWPALEFSRSRRRRLPVTLGSRR